MSRPNNPVGWFEIPVTDMARAKSFYETVFKVKLEDSRMENFDLAMFPMEEKAPGSPGCLIKGEICIPSQDGVLIYFTTPDLDSTIQCASDNHGTVLLNRTGIGEHSFIAILLDTEGNRIGLHACD
jgi:predicted enzyme related to lactoylglutathione lyase